MHPVGEQSPFRAGIGKAWPISSFDKASRGAHSCSILRYALQTFINESAGLKGRSNTISSCGMCGKPDNNAMTWPNGFGICDECLDNTDDPEFDAEVEAKSKVFEKQGVK